MIVQFGGQTPLNLALRLKAAGVPIIGTSPESIDLAEDRKRFGKLLEDLNIPQPPGVTAASVDEALAGAERIGYPVLVRPSYVLGGRAMVIAYDNAAVSRYMKEAVEYSHDRPILIDHFLEDAIEVDVDALSDGKDVVIAGIMQHIEEAGIHSGDSSCVLPAVDIAPATLDTIRSYTRELALALNVIGLVNLQFAIQRKPGQPDQVYVIEVNPRASRTVPYVSKATGIPLAKMASRIMTGRTPPRTASRAGRLRPGPRNGHLLLRQIARLPVEQIPGSRHRPWPGDEIHWRGHGRRRQLWRSLRKGPALSRAAASAQRHRLL